MSEKYSTKELIYFLEGSYAETPPGMMEIVYAKLRAADKLVAAWKAWKANPVKGTAGIVKAISDYEEAT